MPNEDRPLIHPGEEVDAEAVEHEAVELEPVPAAAEPAQEAAEPWAADAAAGPDLDRLKAYRDQFHADPEG